MRLILKIMKFVKIQFLKNAFLLKNTSLMIQNFVKQILTLMTLTYFLSKLNVSRKEIINT